MRTLQTITDGVKEVALEIETLVELTKQLPSDDDVAAKIKIECTHYDTETSHEKADAILCTLLTKLGYSETVKAFSNLERWYA